MLGEGLALRRAMRPVVSYQAGIKKPPEGGFLMGARWRPVSRLDGLKFKKIMALRQ
jgi:hypothetical protein